MSDERHKQDRAKDRSQPFPGRSDIYRWLRANRRGLARKLERGTTSWAMLTEEIIAAGVANRDGRIPSSDSVRRIWATVCRDIAKEQELKAAGRRAGPGAIFPSRISPDWRPMVVVAPQQGSPSVPAGRPAPQPAQPGQAAACGAHGSETPKEGELTGLTELERERESKMLAQFDALTAKHDRKFKF